MPRPPGAKNRTSTGAAKEQVSVKLSPETMKRLGDMAQQEYRTLNQQIAYLLEKCLNDSSDAA